MVGASAGCSALWRRLAQYRALHWHALVEHGVAVVHLVLLSHAVVANLRICERVVVRRGVRWAKRGRIVIGMELRRGSRWGRARAAVALAVRVRVNLELLLEGSGRATSISTSCHSRTTTHC